MVVIDEALDTIEHSQATVDDIKEVTGAIPESIAEKFPDEIEALEKTIWFLREIKQRGAGDNTPLALYDESPFGTVPDLRQLRGAVKGKYSVQRRLKTLDLSLRFKSIMTRPSDLSMFSTNRGLILQVQKESYHYTLRD